MIKQGNKSYLPLDFDIDLDLVSTIEFKFAQENNSNAKTIKSAVWQNGNDVPEVRRIGDESHKTNIIQIMFTQEETYLFKRGSEFYLDTRITLKDKDGETHTGMNVPTPIMKFYMSPSLFIEGESIGD